ncbi:MAG: PD40 domain-containing protein [Ignavibacteriales bacterium]|nr:PD40 domain-containing protein [Ignavibacteriales bacterium]
MEKIKQNSARIIFFITIALLVTQCGKKGENKHFRYVASAEWSTTSYNTLIIVKDEYDEVIGATSGCGSDVVTENVRPPDYALFISDTGETKLKQLFKNERVMPPNRIKWSPLGDKFILYSGRMSTLYIVDTIGLYIKTDSLKYTYDADWSPDGSQIVCSALRGSRLHPSLNIVNASTGVSSLFLPDSIHTGSVSWSANNQLAYVFSRDSTNGLAVINTDGTGKMLIDSSAFFNATRWSPDGATILYTKHLNYDSDVYTTNVFTATTIRRLHFTDDTQIASLRYSPDGQKISYYLYGSSNTTYLYTMNLSDGNAQQIAVQTTDGSWSPDSKQIVYVSYDDIFFKSVE